MRKIRNLAEDVMFTYVAIMAIRGLCGLAVDGINEARYHLKNRK